MIIDINVLIWDCYWDSTCPNLVKKFLSCFYYVSIHFLQVWKYQPCSIIFQFKGGFFNPHFFKYWLSVHFDYFIWQLLVFGTKFLYYWNVMLKHEFDRLLFYLMDHGWKQYFTVFLSSEHAQNQVLEERTCE